MRGRTKAFRTHVAVIVIAIGVSIFAASSAFAQTQDASNPYEELLAPGPNLTILTYGLLIESHLQELESSSDFYKRLMAATTISVPERRLAFDEFFAWWSIETSYEKTYGRGQILSHDLLVQYTSDARLASLSQDERHRAKYVALMLSSFREAPGYALERLKNGESTTDRSLRLRQFASVIQVLAQDERYLRASAAIAILLYDLGYSDLMTSDQKNEMHEVSLGLLRDVRDAAKRADEIDILAPYNLIGGMGLVRLAGPLLARTLARSSTFRFLRYAWSRSTPLQKAAAVGGGTASVALTGAGVAGISSLHVSRRSRAGKLVSPDAEWVLVNQVAKIANAAD